MASTSRRFANRIGAAWVDVRTAADDPERARELLAEHRKALEQFEAMLQPVAESEPEQETEEEGE